MYILLAHGVFFCKDVRFHTKKTSTENTSNKGSLVYMSMSIMLVYLPTGGGPTLKSTVNQENLVNQEVRVNQSKSAVAIKILFMLRGRK